MPTNKNFMFVLHAHIPYVLGTEVEYWLYEVVLHSYLPFLNILAKLEKENKKTSITLNLSPILLVQLDAMEFNKGFQKYIAIRKEILSVDLNNDEKNILLHKEMEQLLELEQLYYFWDSNIIKGFQYFNKLGVLTIVTSAVTHAFLPALYKFPNLLQKQVELGKKISNIYFPDIYGFWSPECGVFPDLSLVLKQNDLQYFFADISAIYDTSNNIKHNNIFSYKKVKYICRDFDSTMKIWDASKGYPSSNSYKEFHVDLVDEYMQIQKILNQHKLLKSGISLYAITDRASDDKNIYSYSKATNQLNEHVKDYVQYLEIRFQNTDFIPVFFDMELFGHWWKEGIDFLYLLIQDISHNTEITFSATIPDVDIPILKPNLSTWGTNNNAESWINSKTSFLWQQLILAYTEMEYYLQYSVPITSDKWYNFLLAQASDWLFLITHDSFSEYSTQTIKNYLNNSTPTTKNLLYTIINSKD